MANRDHLQTLQQGVDAWNAWRDRQPLITPDLGGADLGRANLSEANLSEADLSEANLTEANLSEANLTEANLSEADLSEANLSEANLSEADLSEANLSGANLSGAYLGRANLKVNLSGVDLRGANLGRADLRGANLRGAKLRWADLRGVELSGADLGRADLGEAKLSWANVSGANLSEANLRRANLRRANLRDTNLSEADLTEANLSEADFSWANLSWADLGEAKLSGANLRRANLRRANLRRANLSAADLSEASLRGTELSRADLSEAKLSGADLSGANLRRAKLSGTDLSGADLSEANLRGAELSGADLSEANLRGVELSGADLGRANLSEADRSAAVSQGPDQAEDKAEYVVWYGTNRRPNDPADPGKGYSARRDRVVHYGSCRVFIPQSHKIGSIGSPWWKRLLTLADDRLRLLTVSELAEMAYWEAVVSHLAAVSEDERNALIFVHGYNISFEDAALRAAQIGFDLSVKGAMAFFSWPSRGVPRRYAADAATIEASEGMIADFMTAFAERSGAKAVHIIAHSMGNRGVLRAVNRIAAQAQRRTGRPFGQIILAAADVDADVFRQLCVAYGEVASRTTLYISKRDLALEASHWLHEFPRAGLMPPICIVPGIDTINVTNVDLTMLGHGYVADARDVLGDMHALIRRGAPPHERFGLRETTDEKGQRFWLIGA